MNAYYVQRQFADGLKGGLSIGFADLTRQFSFGSNWRRLHVGFQFAYDDYNNGTSLRGVRFGYGVCCGNVGLWHPCGCTTNWVGVMPNVNATNWATSTWNSVGGVVWNANSGNPYFSYTDERGGAGSKVGTTYAGGNFDNGQPHVPNTYGSVQRRCPQIMYLTKNVGSTSVLSAVSQGAAKMAIACPTSEFVDLTESFTAYTPPTYGALTRSAAVVVTTAVESNGPYDTFNLSWACDNVRLEVYEILAVRSN